MRIMHLCNRSCRLFLLSRNPFPQMVILCTYIYADICMCAFYLSASVIGRATEWNWSAAKEAVPKVSWLHILLQCMVWCRSLWYKREWNDSILYDVVSDVYSEQPSFFGPIKEVCCFICFGRCNAIWDEMRLRSFKQTQSRCICW